MIWYHKEMDENTVVQSGVGHYECNCDVSILIEGLVSKATYTFCLIEHDKLVTSPLNCKSYYTGDDDPDIWLTKDAKAAGLSVLILGLFLMFAIGFLVMYFTVRRFPQIARGSRIVDTGNSDKAMIMPRKSCFG